MRPRNSLRALLLSVSIFFGGLVLSALGADPYDWTPDETYTFPITLHAWSMNATLKVHESTNEWYVTMISGDPPMKLIYSGKFTDAAGQRTFSTPFAHTDIVFKKDGNNLTFVSSTSDFNMAKTPVSPN